MGRSRVVLPAMRRWSGWSGSSSNSSRAIRMSCSTRLFERRSSGRRTWSSTSGDQRMPLPGGAVDAAGCVARPAASPGARGRGADAGSDGCGRRVRDPRLVDGARPAPAVTSRGQRDGGAVGAADARLRHQVLHEGERARAGVGGRRRSASSPRPAARPRRRRAAPAAPGSRRAAGAPAAGAG